MKKSILLPLIILIALLLIGGAYYLYSFSSQTSQHTSSTTSSENDAASKQAEAIAETMYHEPDPQEIVVTDTGFVPADVTITLGQAVTFRNADDQKHEIVSNTHPQNASATELDLGLIDGIDTKSVLLTHIGTYTYYDKLNQQFKGSIVVQRAHESNANAH